MKRAALFAAIVVLAWTAWDTGADPVRFVRGLPWIADFLRRMLPPDLGVLPAALLGAIKTLEIALLGTAVAAVLALPLGFLSARNVAAPTVFHPARITLNFFRSGGGSVSHDPPRTGQRATKAQRSDWLGRAGSPRASARRVASMPSSQPGRSSGIEEASRSA